jgi:hypothetical protein
MAQIQLNKHGTTKVCILYIHGLLVRAKKMGLLRWDQWSVGKNRSYLSINFIAVYHVSDHIYTVHVEQCPHDVPMNRPNDVYINNTRHHVMNSTMTCP